MLEPVSLTVYQTQTAVFQCSISSSSSTSSSSSSIKWLKNDRPLQLDHRMTVLPSGSLEITNVNYPDRGSYKCVSEEDGLISSAADLNLKALIANADPEAPQFLSSPRSQSVRTGDDVTLECSANGLPQPTITWLKDGRELDLDLLDTRHVRTGSGSLTIRHVTAGDEGGYQCRAENTEDSVDSGLVLTVVSAPTLVKSPVSHVAYEKDDILFDCEVEGRPEPEVRWYKNGDLIIQSEYFQVNNIGIKRILC